jgi:glycosyltransferase involved in cell wall biosynthesis
VDTVNYFALAPALGGPYALTLTVHDGLGRLPIVKSADCVDIVLLSGSSPNYQNRRERERAGAFAARTGRNYALRRQVPSPNGDLAAVAAADSVLLMGNRHTLATYSESCHHKIQLLAPSGSVLKFATDAIDSTSADDGFLWYGGPGAVHKGLDLVYEVFLSRPHLPLTAVGPATQEAEMIEVYGSRLRVRGNVTIHGDLLPSSDAFSSLLRRCNTFVMPSCSEGMSTSVLTCLQAGLFPIVSRDCGVTLPAGCGIYLETCAIDEIGGAVDRVVNTPRSTLDATRRQLRSWARKRFSRHAFRDRWRNCLGQILAGTAGDKTVRTNPPTDDAK